MQCSLKHCLNVTLFIPGVPPNGDEDEQCEVTVVIKVSGSVIPAFGLFSSSVLIQLAGEPGWFPAVNRYGISAEM